MSHNQGGKHGPKSSVAQLQMKNPLAKYRSLISSVTSSPASTLGLDFSRNFLFSHAPANSLEPWPSKSWNYLLLEDQEQASHIGEHIRPPQSLLEDLCDRLQIQTQLPPISPIPMPFAIGLSSAFRWGVGSIFPLSLNLEGPAALLQPPECGRTDNMFMPSQRLKRLCMLQLTLLHLCLHHESVTLMGQAIFYKLKKKKKQQIKQQARSPRGVSLQSSESMNDK